VCVAILAGGWWCSAVWSQEPDASQADSQVLPARHEAPLRVPDESARKHPLWPAYELARGSLAWIDEHVDDYTCRMVRRERVGQVLRPYEYAELKIRHARTTDDGRSIPFSAYVHFTKPAAVEGREVLYVEGAHGGRMFVKRGGQRMSQLSAFVNPTSASAMRENRYPITEIGFRNLATRLLENIENDFDYQECEVKFFENAKVGDRVCTRIEVVHPRPRDHFTYHKAMVFVDDERHLPIGFASFDWPNEPGGPPVLLEEYIFTDVKLNVGLGDDDFDRENPSYGFTRYNESSE
jgi:hypothetical protein